MATDKSPTLKEILQDIDIRIAHIEDMTLDHRTVIVKLVRQSNKIVKFLDKLQIEDITEEYEEELFTNPLDNETKVKIDKDKFLHIKDLIEEYMDKFEDLQEFEDELKKNKEHLTPGQVGEA